MKYFSLLKILGVDAAGDEKLKKYYLYIKGINVYSYLFERMLAKVLLQVPPVCLTLCSADIA